MTGGTTGAFVSIVGAFVSVMAGVFVSIVGVELSPFRRLLALAALDQHRRKAGDAHGEHAKHGELQAGTAFALLLEQRALGNEWVWIVHDKFGADGVLSSRRFLLV